MSHMYSSLFVHIVFSTKNRFPYVTPEIRSRLYAYFGGVVRKNGATLIEIGGMPDHMHLLVKLTPQTVISDLLREIKVKTAYWARSVSCEDFEWQDGYGVFSVGQPQAEQVRRYIRNQERRHRVIDYETEYRRMLRRCGIVVPENTMENTR